MIIMLISVGVHGGTAMEKVPIQTMDDCVEIAITINSFTTPDHSKKLSAFCVPVGGFEE